MPSINVELGYFDHPKTKRLVARLGKGAEVLPIRLWDYCGRFHKSDGRLTGYTQEEIESLAGWWGKPGAMIEVMTQPSPPFGPWIDQDADGNFCMHEWTQRQGHLAAFEKKARHAAMARWGHDASSNAPSNAPSMRHAVPRAMPLQFTASHSPPPTPPAPRTTRSRGRDHCLEVGGGGKQKKRIPQSLLEAVVQQVQAHDPKGLVVSAEAVARTRIETGIGIPARPDLKQVIAWLKEGNVRSIAGHFIPADARKFGWNASFLQVDEIKIPADVITWESIVMAGETR